MEVNTYIELADQITNKLIELNDNNKTDNKSFMDLYAELLEDKYREYRLNILTYIPEKLAVKGYVIDSTDPLILKNIKQDFA